MGVVSMKIMGVEMYRRADGKPIGIDEIFGSENFAVLAGIEADPL